MALRSTSALVLLASLLARTTAVRNCWFPDGNTETADTPCDPNADESACCAEGAFCMSNGLCLDGGVFSRGSCTDRNWESTACASQCVDTNPTGGAPLVNCNATLGTWICSVNGDSCDNEDAVFPIDINEMNQIAIRPHGSDSSSLILEPSSSIFNSTESGNATTIVTTVTVSPTTEPSGGFTSGQMAGVGAGVGVPLLLCLLGALFVIFRQRKRLRKAEAYGREHELRPTNYGQHADGYGHFAPEAKVQNAAPYYKPISHSPPAGHFREVEPVPEMDGEAHRQELEVPK